MPAKKLQTFRAPITLLLGVSAWIEQHGGTVTEFYVEAIKEKLSKEGIRTNAVLPK